MCLAVPARVVSLDDRTETAVVELSGVRKEVSTALVEDVVPGDYLLIHVGFALQKLSPDEAEATLALFDELSAFNEEAGDA
ncbi:MAG TPA: HypC/HybG/HupF family hydrogenase formation chaperone [Mariprofundaceae bacterium]|nr:HypC/HybG/HupF family hydrogenase formation chaperone [Mariprofundaceae bacterium]